MRALPGPDGWRPRNPWRRSAARLLRELAERLEPPPHPDAESGAGAAEAVGTERGVGIQRPTSVRRLDISGAPEHWIRLLRDAGLVPSPPNPRSHIPPSPPNARSHIPPTQPNPRSHPQESRAGRTTEPGSSSSLRTGPERMPAPGTISERWPLIRLGPSPSPRVTEGPTAAPDNPRTAPHPRLWLRPPHGSSAELRPFSADHAITCTTPRPDEPQSPAVQRQTALSLPAQPPVAPFPNAHSTTPEPQPTPKLTAPAPQVASPAVVGSETSDQRPSPAPHQEHHPREHQAPGHPSTTPERASAAPLTGNWPELAPRPAPQPTVETSATAAIARAARLSNEQLAV